jgi:multidrug efflux pump subunit AcrB
MNLIRAALRRPVTVIVVVIALALCTILAVKKMAVDIFPNFGLPVIYVAQPYGGMDPAQMEGFLVSYYEYHFLYINGIEHVESKSIQGVALIKLVFHPGTDMSQALAQTVSYVNRAKAFMPPGTVDPFIMRFDVGSLPVGQLIFSSETRTLGEIQDLALFRVRPMFSTLPGVSAPPPFGGNQRTVVIRVDPERLRAYSLSPDEVIKAVSTGNAIMPAGNVRIGDLTRMTPVNSVVANIQELGTLPLRRGSGPTVYLRDIAVVENASDILTGYALVNGKRAVYIPVTKRADASTLSVVKLVKQSLPKFQAAVPEDIHIRFDFDQSIYVLNALRSLVLEGLLGAFLSGLMILAFLRSWRSAFIVILTIPLALFCALIALWIAGQTVNLMTLGGLALAIGILVDESTVAIENIHTHLSRQKKTARAVLDGAQETALPRFLAMLCVISVFIPSFFMVGVAKALFVPLSLAVGFAMVASYLLSSTFVPVLSTWLLRKGKNSTLSQEHSIEEKSTTDSGSTPAVDRHRESRLARAYRKALQQSVRFRWIVVPAYLLFCGLIIFSIYRGLGTELFPVLDTGLFQFRLRAPTGTRVERTESIVLRTLDLIRKEVGPEGIQISSGFVGIQPASYPINTIHLWTSGPHEAVMLVNLKPGAAIGIEDLKERLRKTVSSAFPEVTLSFEPADLISQVMSFGSPTPVEIAVTGPNMSDSRKVTEKLKDRLSGLSFLRDLQIGQALDYPTVNITISRERAGQLGVTAQEIARSLVAATSSSRFIQPLYWRDPASGVAYQIQVEIPQHEMHSLDDLENIPAMPNGQSHPLLGEVAQISYGKMMGEYDRYNMQRMLTLTANVHGSDLGTVARKIRELLKQFGELPRSISVNLRGQIAVLSETLEGLQTGLLLSIFVIFLLLAANFQSLWLALVVISPIPAVIMGVALTLRLTGTTLNVQSFIGAIMAIGISVANAILLVTFAENRRREIHSASTAALDAAQFRLRPILMTSFAMIAGMIPIAFAVGEGGQQTAPLGKAVIGGLGAATLATLFLVPSFFAIVQHKRSFYTSSLDPDDPGGRYGE